MTSPNPNHYTYRVSWSAEDDAYVGTIAEMPSLSWIASEQGEAFSGIRELVASIVMEMLNDGETPPEPLGERTFSGKFMVRLPPETHRRLVVAAAEQNVSLNRLVSSRLESA